MSGIKTKDLQFYQVSCGGVYEHYCFSKLTIRNEFQHILCAGDPGHLLNMPKLVPKSRWKVWITLQLWGTQGQLEHKLSYEYLA